MFEELGLNTGALGRQRRQPAPGQPLGLARRRHAGDADRPAGQPARGGPVLGPGHAAPAQEEVLGPTPARRRSERVPGGRAGPRPLRSPRSRVAMTDIEDRLEELKESGLYRKLRVISGPQGPRVLLDGRPVLLLCSNNYLGLADHPRVREAAAEGAMRWGVGAGSSRLVSGGMTIHRRLEDQLAAFKRTDACLLFGSGYLANTGIVSALAREGEVVFSDALNHASIVDGCRLVEGRDLRLPAQRHGAPRVGPPRGRRPRVADRHRRRLLDGRRHRAARGDRRARGPLRRAGDGRRRARHWAPSARAAAGRWPTPGLEDEVDVVVGTLGKALGSYGAYACCDKPMAKYLINCARTVIFSTALPPPAVAGALAALEILRDCPSLVDKLQRNARVLREALAAEGVDVPDESETQIVPIVVGDAAATMAACERALGDGDLRPGHPAADRAGRHLAAASGRHGVAHEVGAAQRRDRPGARGPDRGARAQRRADAPPARVRACTTASPKPRSLPRHGGGRSEPGGAPARHLRHRHGHRRGQVRGRRGDLRRAGRARREGRGVQAGDHRARRARRRLAARRRAARPARERGAVARGGLAAPLRTAGVAAPGRRDGRRADRAARAGPRGARARREGRRARVRGHRRA